MERELVRRYGGCQHEREATKRPGGPDTQEDPFVFDEDPLSRCRVLFGAQVSRSDEQPWPLDGKIWLTLMLMPLGARRSLFLRLFSVKDSEVGFS